MRKLFYWILIVLGLGVVALPSPSLAQVSTVCADRLAELLAAFQTACEGLATDQACVQQELIDTADLAMVQTTALDEAEMAQAAALLHIPTSRLDQPLAMALFGEATLTNLVVGERPTLAITNTANFNINLREAPGTAYALAGSFLSGASAVVDGKNANGDWLHIRTETSSAWMYAPLLTFEAGQLDSLAVVDDLYPYPMQAVTLTTNVTSTACGAGSVGLLIEHHGDSTAYLQVNGVALAMRDGAALLQVTSDGLQAHILRGSLIINETEVNSGALVHIEADVEPTLVQAVYAFNDVLVLPYGLVADDALACIVGVVDGTVGVYRLPDMTSEALGELVSSAHYPVTGQAADEDETVWWRISVDGARAWVPQVAVLSAGACANVPEVSPTAPVVSGSGGGSTGGSSGGTGSALVPSGTSVWQAVPSTDIMSGTCNTPAIVLCEHLVAITPSGGTLSWRGQEPTPYTMYSTGGDSYSYTGRNRLNNANLTLTLTFTSPTTWVMTWRQVVDADPTCVHTFNYTGSFLR